MRTTIDLTPEAYHVAKAIARERDQSLGKAVSDLILQPRSGAPPEGAKSDAGFPLFSSGRPVTADDVQSILDEEPELVQGVAVRAAAPVYLLDANVLIALTDTDHVSHAKATDWFVRSCRAFATCPVTQGALVRFMMRARPGVGLAAAKAFVRQVSGVNGHRFWPDSVSYEDLPENGIVGHRQVTDAYLVALARHNNGALATLDRSLAGLHGERAVLIGGH